MMGTKRFHLSALQSNVVAFLLYAMMFASFLLNRPESELYSFIIMGIVFVVGGTLGFLTHTLAFIPIISDFIGLKGYDNDEPVSSSMGSLINIIIAIVGGIMLIGLVFSHISG